MTNSGNKIALAAAFGAALTSASAFAEDNTINFGGRIHLDAALADDDGLQGDSGTEFRRVRLGANGIVAKNWNYKVEVDFANDASNIQDAYISRKLGRGTYTLGQFKAPFGLENLTSSNNATFMERALVAGLAPGRRIGLGGQWGFKKGSVAAALFGQAEGTDAADGRREGVGAAVRGTFAPVNNARTTVHLGAALSYESPNDEEVNALAAGGTVGSIFNGPGLAVAAADAENKVTAGIEAGLILSNFHAQFEYGLATISRETAGADDAEITAGSLQAGVFLTGHKRSYNTGKGAFGAVALNGKQALELALRYELAEVDLGGANEPELSALTFGVNWYVNDNVRFMLNYVDAELEAGNTDNGVSYLQARAQVVF